MTQIGRALTHTQLYSQILHTSLQQIINKAYHNKHAITTHKNYHNSHKDLDNDQRLEDSWSQISKSPALLDNILKQFNNYFLKWQILKRIYKNKGEVTIWI